MKRFGRALEERDFRLWWLASLGMQLALIGLAEFIPTFVLALPVEVAA